MRKLECLRCGSAMAFLKQEKFQQGDSGPWVGNLNFSFQGGFEMELYSCNRCGKIEFFLPGVGEEELEPEELPPEYGQNIVSVDRDGMPQVQCPACGKRHDFDYPQCPGCGHRYYNR